MKLPFHWVNSLADFAIVGVWLNLLSWPDVVVRQDLLRWLKKESEERGATIVYATHIFDGLEDWPSHVHYLHYTGVTGWQGRLEDLEMYQKLRAVISIQPVNNLELKDVFQKEGNPSPLLRIAEIWLRAELREMKEKAECEPEDGIAARAGEDVLTTPCTCPFSDIL